MKQMFQKTTILGFGMIGSSLARAMKQRGLTKTIACGDISADVCKKVLELKLADTADTDLTQAVKAADLVIICVPVGVYGQVAKTIAPHLKKDAIITDVGSVKEAVIAAVTPHIPTFVPGHPIAGLENSGPEAGQAELFEDHWCILTPITATPKDAVDRVAALWTACGAKVEIMDAKRHDLVLAVTSHLPHLIAYSIVDTASTLEDDTREEVMKFSAGGFRSVTRTAASDPVMWRDIFLNNREAVLEILQRFSEDITGLQKAIRSGNGTYMEEVFTRTRAIRRGVIEGKPTARK